MAKQIGDIIRFRREELGLTQEELAERIGNSAGYIGQLERGLSMASIPTLKRLINVLALDANLIFYDQTIFYKGIMPSEKVLDLPMDCNTLTGSVNL